MKKMVTSIEGVCHEASVLKSSGSDLMRTRLSIDLNLPLPVIVNGGDCQHFLIRNPSEQLPPLHIQKNKQWQSANCIRKIGVDENESLHEKETDSDLSKLLKVRQASSHMNVAPDKKFQRGNFSKGKDFVQMPIGIEMVTSQLEKELYQQKLGQTLSNFRDAQNHVENDTFQSKSIPNCPLTLQKRNKSWDPLGSNVVESGQFSRKEVIDLNKKIDLNQWQISPNLLQWGNLQIPTVEMPCPNNNININEFQGHSYVTIPQRNQRQINVIERGPSTYVPPMRIVEMSKNLHERIHPKTQNRLLSWSNPLSASFHPLDADVNVNFGLLRGNTAMVQQQFKLSNLVQVSAPVPTGWVLQHGVWLPIAQNIAFRPDTSQNYHNQKIHKCGQAAPGSLQKGRTISDIKNVDLKSIENMRTTCMRSLNPSSSGGMLATQLLRHQERPFAPCNIHPPFRMDENQGQSSQKHISYFKDQVVSFEFQEKKRKAHTPAQLVGRKL